MKSRKLAFVNIDTTNINLNRIIKLFSVLFILTLAISACSSESAEGVGIVKINLYGASASREAEAVGFPPGEHVAELGHKVIFTGNGRTLSFELGKGVRTYTATVPVGNWNITIKAYWRETFLYAKGNSIIDVKAGQSNQVLIDMEPAFYKEGDIGPGGGYILGVADGLDGRPFGFLNTATGQICHYLEVAKDEVFREWASPGFETIDIAGTEKGIGTGGKNTALILAKDPAAPAALYCKNYIVPGYPQNDWFLPSYDELEVLCSQFAKERDESFRKPDDFTEVSGFYWASTQYSNSEVWGVNYEGHNNNDKPFDFGHGYKIKPIDPGTDAIINVKVRPMRAFAE